MCTIKSYLMALCLCLPTMLTAQEINLLLEDELEEMAADEEATNYGELLEELSQPIDLNTATKEQLAARYLNMEIKEMQSEKVSAKQAFKL